MAEETHAAPPPPSRVEDHTAAAANPEQHLLDAHKLSIRIQGKPGPTGLAVWALVRDEGSKVKTLNVHRGTRREAASHFFDYIHPDKSAIAPPAPARRQYSPRPRSSRPPQDSQRRPR